MPAPVSTSLNQCLLLIIRESPVAVAVTYPPTLYHGLRVRPYSLCSSVAVRKAVAAFAENVQEAGPLTAQDVDDRIHSIESEFGIQQDHLKQPLRIAITGVTVGAGICETIELIGGSACAVRIARALSLQRTEI